jgi:hypothetical protein
VMADAERLRRSGRRTILFIDETKSIASTKPSRTLFSLMSSVATSSSSGPPRKIPPSRWFQHSCREPKSTCCGP